MNFALIPVTKEELNDRFFYTIDENGEKIWVEDQLKVYWEWFHDRGHLIQTIDKYASYDEIDYILLYWLDFVWIRKLTKAGQNNKIIYCNAEPPTVISWNCPEGYKTLKKMFPYILHWNSDWVDNEYIFKKNIPYIFAPDFGQVPFAERKLATAITAYKTSDYVDELYSEREAVYTYFEKNYPDQFDFYGWGWSKEQHPCYGGTVKNKKELYHGYKFSICLENTKNIKDYVTEKILDCLCAGIVPVYGGASNVDEYIPRDCYIDYFAFANYDELATYLTSMTEDEYQGYLDRIRQFVETMDIEPYRYFKIAESAWNAVQHPHTIKVPLHVRLMIEYRGLKEEYVYKLKKLLGKVK